MGRTVLSTVVIAMLIAGQVSSVGRVLVSVTPEYGLHAGDVVVLAGWLAVLTVLLARHPSGRARVRHRS